MNQSKIRGLVIIGGMIVICLGIILLSFNMLRFHPVYTQGMEIVESDPEVLALFGSPLRGGIFVPGTTEKYRYGGGIASLETAISGPKTRGTLNIFGSQAEKNGAWQIDTMTIRVNGEMILKYSLSQAEAGFQPIPSRNQTEGNESASTPPSK